MPKSVRRVTITGDIIISPSIDGATRSWSFVPADQQHQSAPGLRVLYLESYGSGSHERVAKLLQQHSTHQIDIILLPRDHWRWLALTGHRVFAEAIAALNYARPDLVVCSGPAPASRILTKLPATWGRVASVAYFHETQWSYPAGQFDPRPYLVDHLETLEAVDQLWFNSRFHQRDFRASALANPSSQLRKLADDIIGDDWQKTQVLHPPVAVDSSPAPSERPEFAIAWAARWEREKRPDIFIDALLEVASQGLRPVVHILGSPSGVPTDPYEIPLEIRRLISPASGFPDRDTYEALLARTDVWVSTAEHEFFGVAAIEAALLGATPILPRALAYPETLPSAPSYTPGDHMDLARTILASWHHRFQATRPWQYDASRFLPAKSTRCFDRLVESVASVG